MVEKLESVHTASISCYHFRSLLKEMISHIIGVCITLPTHMYRLQKGRKAFNEKIMILMLGQEMKIGKRPTLDK